MRRPLTLLPLVLVLLVQTVHADLRSDETEFGEHSYKAMRAIHDQSCSCKEDGNCHLKVSRAEVKAQLVRFKETVATMLPRLWPDLTKQFGSLSTPEAKAYGERLGQEYLQTLPRKTVLLWAQMLSTCWGTSSDPADQPPVDPSRTWRSGSLNVSQWGAGFVKWSSGYTDEICKCRDVSCVESVEKRWMPAVESAYTRAPEFVRLVKKHGSDDGPKIFLKRVIAMVGQSTVDAMEQRSVTCLRAAGVK